MACEVAGSTTYVDNFLIRPYVEEAGVELVEPGLRFEITTIDFSATTKIANAKS